MKIIFTGIAAAFALSSCQLMVEVDIPEDPPKLVVNSLFTPDSTWQIDVSASAPILSQFSPGLLYEPAAVLSDDNGSRIELELRDPYGRPDVNTSQWTFSATAKPQPGMKYSLEVSAQGHETIVTTAVTPESVTIIDAKLDSSNMAIGPSNERIIPIEITFRDPAGRGDHYFPVMHESKDMITVFNGDTTVRHRGRRVMLESNDPTSELADFNGDVVAFDDANFDGEVYTLRRFLRIYPEQFHIIGPDDDDYIETVLTSLRFELVHSSEEYFKYIRSVLLQRGTADNPFAQPVQVYSNVDGGLGIFAGVTSSSWEFVE